LLTLHDKRTAAARFDPASGDVLDAALRAKLAAVVDALAALTRKLGGEVGGLAPTALA
jgi:hypothetical protein